MTINPVARMMVSAKKGTILEQAPARNNRMDSTNKIDKIQFFFFQRSFFVSTQRIFSSHLYPSGTSKKKLSALRPQMFSKRIALRALADADHLQKSFSSVGAGIQGRQSNW